MKVHHRNYPFRPPRRVETLKEGSGLGLVLRFARTYLGPYRWTVLLCMLLVGLNACSVYLISYYGRIVVDHVLVVAVDEAVAVDTSSGRGRPWAAERPRRTRIGPRQGLGRQIDMGMSSSSRAPGAGQRLLVMFLVYIGTMVTLNFSARLAQRTRIGIGQRMTAQLREDMHKKILDLSLSYHKAHDPGQLLSRIVSDVGIVQQRLMTSLMQASASVAMLVAGFAILLAVQWRLAAIVIAVVPLYAAIYRRKRPQIRTINREMRHTNSCLFSLCSQKIDAMKAIQAYGRTRHERLNFHRLTACFLRDALYQQRLSAGLSRTSMVISGVCTTSILLLGGRFVLDGELSLGQMMFLYGTTANLFMPVIQLTQLTVVYNHLLVILQRVVSVLDQPIEIAEDPDAVDSPAPVQQGISLERVTFGYGTEPDAEPILRNINLKVPAGTWLCVMGPSGCGKTTLLYLLARLYEPNNGKILIDGVPLSKIKMSALRTSIGFVPQEAQIIRGTVRDNICYGVPDAEPKQIIAAAKAAEMHDFILEMAVQYETTIGEKGTSLSGGQRQRLSLARALLTNPEILLLDDCTSALDADTEARIQATLAQILVGKTAVIVSQRVSMAKHCHQICTLQDGVIAEYGTHDELVNADGFYAKLHAQQTE